MHPKPQHVMQESNSVISLRTLYNTQENNMVNMHLVRQRLNRNWCEAKREITHGTTGSGRQCDVHDLNQQHRLPRKQQEESQLNTWSSAAQLSRQQQRHLSEAHYSATVWQRHSAGSARTSPGVHNHPCCL